MYRLPNINAPTDSGKIAQIQDYLFQLVRQMNMGETSSSDTSVAAPLVEEQMDMHSVDVPIEIGTSGIWTYRKWASGLAECWGELLVSDVTCSVQWGVLYDQNTPSGLVPYPFTFAEIPVESISARAVYGGSAFLLEYGGISNTRTTSGAVYFARPSKDNIGTACLSFNVKGRWK